MNPNVTQAPRPEEPSSAMTQAPPANFKRSDDVPRLLGVSTAAWLKLAPLLEGV
jgi:hypothetical protein